MDKKKYYQQNADKLGWGLKTAQLKEYRKKILKKHLQGNKILDIGCGSGLWVDYLNKQNLQATGVDFVKKFIRQAKKQCQGEFIHADAKNLPFENNQFDTVYLISLLEHIKNDLKILQESKRVGKRIIFVVPQKTPQCLIKKGVIFKHHLDKTHLRVYTKQTIQKLVKQAGLDLIKIEEIERLPAISLFSQLFQAPNLIKKITTKLFFTFFQEKNYYLELLAVCE